SGCPDRVLPGALPCGVRTFLVHLAATRPSGSLRRPDCSARGRKGRMGGRYPSVSWLIWYCSSFLYRLLRGVPITSAVFEMFQPFSRSLPTRNIRSAFSLNSRSVPAFASAVSPPDFGVPPPPDDHAAGDRTISGRSARSIVSPPVM